MTTQEAANVAAVSSTVIKRWISRGDIQASRVGRGFEVDQESLLAYLATRTKTRGPDKVKRKPGSGNRRAADINSSAP